MGSLLRLDDVTQNPVDTKAHQRPRLERLDVDVRGLFPHRLCEQRVDQAHNRRIPLAFEEILGFWQMLGELRQVEIVVQVAHDLLRL